MDLRLLKIVIEDLKSRLGIDLKKGNQADVLRAYKIHKAEYDFLYYLEYDKQPVRVPNF